MAKWRDGFIGCQVMIGLSREGRSTDLEGVASRFPFLWIVLGVLVVCAIMLASAPANWVARYVASRSEGRILLADARGTVWRGDAVLAFAEREGVDAAPGSSSAAPSTALALPGRINWVAQMPHGLALGLLVTHDGVLQQPLRVRFGVGVGEMDVAAGVATLPASLLRLVGAPLNTLRPEGRLAVQWDALEIGSGKPLIAAGTVRVGELAVAISPVRPLGDYRIAWKVDQRGLTWRLETERGPLQLEGVGTMPQHAGANVRASVQARVAADASPQTVVRLKPLLDSMGRRSGDGAVIEIGT